MAGAQVESAARRRAVRLRQFERLLGDVRFGVIAALGELLDDMAVMVARGEIHLAVSVRGVAAQRLLDPAHGLNEFAPVHGAEETQAADAVADGDLVSRLLPDLGLDLLFDGQAVVGQPGGDPLQRERQRRALALQPARHFGHETAAHRLGRTRHVGHQQDQVARLFLGRLAHLVGPGVGAVALLAVVVDAGGDAAQILDQRDAQHDRDRPQLAQLERRDVLVGNDEARQAFRVDPAVAVRNDFEGDLVDARIAFGVVVGQARQLPAVVSRQVTARRADLFFDQVKVIQQPLGGRGDLAPRLDGGGQFGAGGGNDVVVVGEAGQQPVRAAALAQPVARGQVLAVGGHLGRAEQFRAQRQFFGGDGGAIEVDAHDVLP